MERKQTMNKVLNAESYKYSQKAIDLWKEKGYEYVSSTWDEIDSKSNFNDISVLIIRLNRFVDAEVLHKFTNLKYVVSATTGHDHIDIEYLEQRNIKLMSLRGHDDFLKTIPSTAEHTWALLMALIRNIPEANRHVKSGGWDRDLYRGYQLKEKEIGIIGLGRTGLMVANYAKAFSMKVKYFDPFVSNSEYLKCETLQKLLETSDIISLHIHLDNKTEKFINQENIKFIKKSALMINTSRGNIWDERAIANAINDKQVAGVASDVLSTELDDIRSSPLWQAQQQGKNVILTPHIGGATYDAMWACEEFIVNSIK